MNAMTNGVIGLYAHHVGSGHLRRARALQSALRNVRYSNATILSSRSGADVTLPLDHDGDPRALSEDPARDVTANSTLHWAPIQERGLTQRMAMIAEWIVTNRPAAMVVDISVEVAVFCRLMGVPVITTALPGNRPDSAHALGYSQASAIIGAWPTWAPVAPSLIPYLDTFHAVGGMSLTEGSSDRRTISFDRDTVVVLRGAGGDDWDEQPWDRIRQETPEVDWVMLGGGNRVEDPLPYLGGAAAVVSAAGQNSVADIAVAGTPAVIIPQRRPFEEQTWTAEILRDAGLAEVPEVFPAPHEWRDVIQRAVALKPEWSRWETSGSAERAALVIDDVIRRYR